MKKILTLILVTLILAMSASVWGRAGDSLLIGAKGYRQVEQPRQVYIPRNTYQPNSHIPRNTYQPPSYLDRNHDVLGYGR